MTPSLEIAGSSDREDVDLIVVKSNHLIEAKYKLSHSEQRLVLYIIAHVNPQAQLFNDLYLSLPQISKIVQKHITFAEAEKLIEGLFRQEIDIWDPITQTRKLMRWLSVAEFNARKGLARLGFDNEMKPYLLNLKERFTMNSLNQVLRLKSAYTIRLYELLSVVRNMRKRQRVFDYAELRATLGANDDYDWYDFKRWILEPARKEMAESTDITFTYKEKRVRRKVIELAFSIKFAKPDDTVQQTNLLEEVKNHGKLDKWQVLILGRVTSDPFCMNPAVAERLLREQSWPQKYWKWVLDNKEKSLRFAKDVTNPGGLTYEALNGNYTMWQKIQETKRAEAARDKGANVDNSSQLSIFDQKPPEQDRAAAEVWEKIQDILADTTPAASTKLERAVPVKFEGTTLTLWLPTLLTKHLVEQFYPQIANAVRPYTLDLIAPTNTEA